MDGSLTYNSTNLQTYDPLSRTGVNINSIQHTSTPQQIAQIYLVANASDSEVPDLEYPNRVVIVAGTIHGNSQNDLDTRIDSFKAQFVKRNKDLAVDYGGGDRIYRVMKHNAFSVDRRNRSLFAQFSIELLCKPFGTSSTDTNLWAEKTGFSSNTFTETPFISGSAPYQHPVFTITVNSLTGGGDYVQIKNNNNNQTIIILGINIVDGDVLVIDCEQRTVTRNGDEVDYSGTFIELEEGSNSITYSDGFTTRNVDVAASYNRKYL